MSTELEQLRKQNRILAKQLHRSESDRAELELTREKSDALLRKVIAELRESQSDLNEKSEQLQQTVTELNAAQAVLIQSAKMAALGELVAGVSHEINTPIGVSVTAASHLVDISHQLRTTMEASQLTPSGLRKFVQNSVDSAEMILDNLRRASELVQSFKLVAVDRSVAGMRDFNVAEYLHTVLNSISSQLRKTRVATKVTGPDDICIHSDPGLFSQIMTNLLMNSLIHGYADQDVGTIRMSFRADGDQLILLYEDDGCGIDQAHLSRIFDPFFTTRRGQGGSGLGLHIVYNIVVEKMKGGIECCSTLGEGATFRLRLPGLVDQVAEPQAIDLAS